jgi:hypothetical protein
VSVTKLVWTGDEKLRLCARQIRRRAKEKHDIEKAEREAARAALGLKPMQWIQVDARDELARIVGAEAKQKIEDAPPERDE